MPSIFKHHPSRVLLIDDNLSSADILLNMLGHLGYYPEHVQTISQALLVLSDDQPFKLILMNLAHAQQSLPGKDKSASLFDQDIPVLIYTPNSVIKDYEQACLRNYDNWVSQFKLAEVLATSIGVKRALK